MPYRKNAYKVNIPRSSGFDKSHRYSGTGHCGTLIPVMCDEVVPGTKVRLRVPFAAQLPPLASETFMNAQIKYEAFFIPLRLLCASFESFFNDHPERIQVAHADEHGSQVWVSLKGLPPAFRMYLWGTETEPSTIGKPGSLSDYLGFCSKHVVDMSREDSFLLNPLPFVAYHLVWQEWYRNPRVQNPAFTKPLCMTGTAVDAHKASTLPYVFFHNSEDAQYFESNYLWHQDLSNFQLADGLSLFDLRQRNFGLDYFTGARVSAQQGDPAGVTIDTSGSEGTMTIAALRAANSLQQFRERNNLASPRFVDQIQDRYGVRPSDGVAQRPICIGSASYDISTRGVDQTAGSSEQSSTRNPFDSVAAQYGRAAAMGADYLIEDFEALEPGYILVMQSLVPEPTYTVGVDPIFTRYRSPGSIVEMANPLLQNVGDEPIYEDELLNHIDSGAIFGYTDRFSKFMFKRNSVHGELRAGESLGAFVLQRNFGMMSEVTLSSQFLEIPKNYLDQILAVNASVSDVGYWFDLYFDYKVTMPLAEYSIPSLQDPAYEHGKTISIRRNGQIF